MKRNKLKKIVSLILLTIVIAIPSTSFADTGLYPEKFVSDSFLLMKEDMSIYPKKFISDSFVFQEGQEEFIYPDKFISDDFLFIKPEIAINGIPDVWTNKDIELSIQIVLEEGEDTSGYAIILPTDNPEVSNEVTGTLANLTIKENGEYFFKVKTPEGDLFDYSLKIEKIDKVAPTKPSVSIVDNKIVLVEGTDDMSGINNHMYSLDGANWIEWTENIDLIEFKDGEYTLQVKAIDRATNESETEVFNFTLINKAVEEATIAVELAETTLTEVDYNTAKDLVDALPEGQDKTDLLDRLEEVKSIIELNKKKDEIKDLIENLDSLEDLTAIEDLINSIEDEALKAELRDLLDNKANEIEEAEELQRAIDEATIAVELAETTKSQEDVDTARDLVNSLPNSPEKTNLNSRLDAVQAEIDYQKALDEAIVAVELAESTKTQEDVNSAYSKVNKLPNSAEKSNLINRLKAVEAEILAKLAREKAEKEAIRAVELAESLKREPYIQQAKDKVAKLENKELKDALEERLLRLEEAQNADSEAILKSATRFVEMAELLKREPHISNAKKVVEALKPSQIKTELLLRIEAIKGALTEEAKALIEATTYVETAEKYGYASVIRKAEEKVNSLNNSPEKTALLERLNIVKNK